MTARILLVRHCESAGQHPEAPLTELGRLQAEQLAKHLEALELECSRIVSSPFRRAVQTIEPYGELAALPVDRDERLRERHLSDLDLDDWLEHLERTWHDFDYRAPGGETSREAQHRGRAALDEIAAGASGPTLLVSHGNLMSLLLNSVDKSYGFDAWRAMTNPDVFLLEAQSAGYAIRRLWAS